MAAPIYALFHTYEVKYSPFLEYIEGITENDQTNLILDWFLSQESSFEELWEKIADEVFHILYSNRSFLLKFNNNLSHYLAKNPVLIPREARTKMGKIRRTHLPKWVKRAVFYRDQGRCVFCDKDLSGLLSVQEGVHFDHIVPLNLLGTNDPSNFQLLCEQCNLQKSGRSSSTSYRYKSWWDY
jgi:hypothetical protein